MFEISTLLVMVEALQDKLFGISEEKFLIVIMFYYFPIISHTVHIGSEILIIIVLFAFF